jgi:hypothetical protein
MMVSKNITPDILKIISKKYKSIFKIPMSLSQVKKTKDSLIASLEDGTLFYKLDSNGKIAYFFTIQNDVKDELGEKIFCISLCYCNENSKNRISFLKLVSKVATKAKKDQGLKKMAIAIYHDDLLLKKYFAKKGYLTAIEFVGNTQYGLRVLSKEKNIDTKGVKITRLQKNEIAKLVKLEIASHISEPTSRMRKMFTDPRAKKMMTGFYKRVVKEKSCFVIKKNNKLAGSIGYFSNKKSKMGFVGSIFVAEEFRGMGFSKLLYKKLFEEFSKRKLTHYIGSTTTNKVISLGKKLKRKEYRSIYIVKI